MYGYISPMLMCKNKIAEENIGHINLWKFYVQVPFFKVSNKCALHMTNWPTFC